MMGLYLQRDEGLLPVSRPGTFKCSWKPATSLLPTARILQHAKTLQIIHLKVNKRKRLPLPLACRAYKRRTLRLRGLKLSRCLVRPLGKGDHGMKGNRLELSSLALRVP